MESDSDDSLNDQLQRSASAMSAHSQSLSAPVLTEAEKAALRNFCVSSLKVKEAQTKASASRKDHAKKVKERRTQLHEWIKEQDSRCFTLPRELYRKADEELGKEGLPTLPPYIRLQRNTADATITAAVTESAIMNITDAEIREQVELHGKNPMQALIAAIVDGARNTIRSTKEAVALSDKLERGQRDIDITEVPPDIAKLMLEMHKHAAKAKQKTSDLKEKTATTSAKLKELEPLVSQTLDKTGRNSQTVQLDGVKGRHTIKKTCTAKAPRVTLKLFEENLSTTIAGMGLETRTLERLLESFNSSRKELVKRLQLRLTSLPKKESTSVKLVSIADDEEEEEDE